MHACRIIQSTEKSIRIHSIQSLPCYSLKVAADVEKIAPLLLKGGPRNAYFRKFLLAIRDFLLDVGDQSWKIAMNMLEQYTAETAAQTINSSTFT